MAREDDEADAMARELLAGCVMNEKEEAMLAQTRFEDMLQRLTALLDTPGFVVCVEASATNETQFFGTDFVRELVRRGAAAPALYEALEPVKRGAQEADYYCPDDVPDDHTVLISMTIGELRAARAAISAAKKSRTSP